MGHWHPSLCAACLLGSRFHCLAFVLFLQVGIVGRTGSGKTTLLMALFRMINLAGGRIIMDGQDIGALPLREVCGRTVPGNIFERLAQLLSEKRCRNLAAAALSESVPACLPITWHV